MEGSGNAGFGTLDADAVRSLLAMVGGDRDVLAEIVDAFVEEAPQRLDELRRGIDSGDADLVGRAAHTLKANAKTFGAGRLAVLSADIESAARSGDLAPASAHIEELEAAWSDVQPDLAELAAGGGA